MIFSLSKSTVKVKLTPQGEKVLVAANPNMTSDQLEEIYPRDVSGLREFSLSRFMALFGSHVEFDRVPLFDDRVFIT